MKTSSSLDRWQDYLRDKDFWLNEYRHTKAYLVLRNKVIYHWNVLWNVGVGPTASFTRAISGISEERLSEWLGPFNHVIKVDLKATPTAEEAIGRGITSIKYQLAIAAAQELGLLDQEHNRLKEKHDELQFYTYGRDDGGTSRDLKRVVSRMAPQINKLLSAKKYLLVVENLQWPIELATFTLHVGLLQPNWTDSRWLISTTCRDAYNKSKSEGDIVISIDEDDQVVVLTLSALRQSAKHIFNMICQESEEYWHHIALGCFHYAMIIFAEHSQAAVTSNELIHQWHAQGILPRMSIKEDEIGTCSSKCAYMHQVGRVILEAFHKYSVLQLPFSPANEAHEAFNTAAQFLTYHELVAERITVADFSDDKKWISFVSDHGWHVSHEWLSQEETSGPTALILKCCSEKSLIFSKLDHCYFLRVLDLSYTPLKSLHSSIGCLLNLRLLSLRGCHDLKTLFSSSTTFTTDSTMNSSSYSPLSTLCQLEILDMNGVPLSHLTQEVANQKSNLLYLDMSYSEVTTFPPNFFQDMSNLEELILVNCSNLVELPHSMVALSGLMTLEITGTQIKYFPQKIFEEMQKLQSLKLIDNKKLISLAWPISRSHGLIDQYTEGWESNVVEEIKLEGHPTLISFLLIGAPRIRCLSLRGCRKLESVELKNLSALEELDLSGTAIKELPTDIPHLPQLRQLLLMGVPSLRRFPWHNLQRLPDVFYLDQCAEGNGNHSDQVAQVCVSDSRLFYSFNSTTVNLVRDGRFFQSFYVRVAPCITNSRRLQDEEGMLGSKLQEMVQNQSTYVDVYSSYSAKNVAIASPMIATLRRSERHVEIMGMQLTPDGLYYLLNVAETISVTYDTSIFRFHELSRFEELEECELRLCHKMENVFSYGTEHLKSLRNVYVCNLKNLVRFCSEYSSCVFVALEHLHLEYCPRLVDMVPYETTLPCLKTLDILFCYNLKTIFNSRGGQGGTYQLPSLQKIHLQELPHLQHFHDNDATIAAPMWKELHVRGCWSLRRLPCLQDQLKKVKVNGERSWWRKLQWDSDSLLHHDSYEHKLPQEFASFDTRAKRSSYLR